MHNFTLVCNPTTLAYIYIALSIGDDWQNCHATDML